MRLLPALSELFSSRPKQPTAAVLYDEVAVDKIMAALTRMPDPDGVLKQAGMTRADLRKMESDDEICAALDTRRDAVIATQWRLEPTGQSVGRGKAGFPEAAEWLWAEIEPHMQKLLSLAWHAVPYGYSVGEAVYRRAEDGRIGLANIIERPIEWFAPHPDGRLIWKSQSGCEEAVDTTVKFFLTVRHGTAANPYGESLLSRLYWAWFFRHNSWRFWMQFLERFGTPLLLGKVNDPAALRDAVNGMGMFKCVVGVHPGEDVQAVTVSGAGEFEKADNALSRRIQKVILGQTLTSDVGNGGSFAAAKVHDNVRDDKRLADLRLVTGTVQHLVNALWRLNNYEGKAPRFVMGDGRGLEFERAKRDAELAKAGICTFTEQYLLRVYDFEDGDVQVGTSNTDVVRLSASGPFLGDRRPRDQRRYTLAQEAIEHGADTAMAIAGDPIDIDKIRSAVFAARDPDDLADRLAILLDDQRPEFSETLDRALFAAEVLGYVSATEHRT